MRYNTDFLVASLIFLLLILYHFASRKKLEDSNSRIFRLCIFLGIMDILFDLITTLMISDGKADLTGITHLLLSIFYLLQVLVPYVLFLYSWSLSDTSGRREYLWFRILSLPAILTACMVLYNFRSGIFFFIDMEGNYIRGPLYLYMYLYAGIYGILILISCIVRYQKLGFQNFCIVCEFLIILAGCVAVQAIRNDLLTTGLGLGLGITALYLTINNPSNYTDRLTNDFNLRSFLGYLDELFRRRRKFHVLSVTVQNLNQINLLLGFSAGDTYLRRLSEKMNAIVDTPYVFRISSRRFVILTFSLAEYDRVRTELLRLFNDSLTLNGERIPLSAVICGILNVESMESKDALLAYMDYLASLAPSAAETRLIQSDEQIRKGFLYNNEIEHYLHTAIEEDLFEVYYQPVFSLEKGDYVALEALSRLRHPALGAIFPDVFIGIAERNGQTARIGLLQLQRICRFVNEHPGLLTRIHHINYNLSPAELLREGYARQLIEIIRNASLPFSFFQFEITETVATQYSERLYEFVENCTKCGIRFSLDDFGSGYANLNTVLRLPFSSIKLDRSLLIGIRENEKNLLFYKSIVHSLKSMEYSVIAEGVEQPDQLELLQSFGVDMIQGFYFSAPLEPDALLQLLEAPPKREKSK